MTHKSENLYQQSLDEFTGFNTQLTGDHRYVHDGKAFSVSISSSSVAAGGTYSIEFTTPSSTTGKYIHWRPAGIHASANWTTVQLIEGAGGSTTGTAQTPWNRNRNSTATSAMTKIYSGATLSTAGNYLDVWSAGVTGAGGSSNSGGESGGAEHEIVLIPGTKYGIKATVSGATTASVTTFNLFWYEEDDG